jgi:hypothetical protein
MYGILTRLDAIERATYRAAPKMKQSTSDLQFLTKEKAKKLAAFLAPDKKFEEILAVRTRSPSNTQQDPPQGSSQDPQDPSNKIEMLSTKELYEALEGLGKVPQIMRMLDVHLLAENPVSFLLKNHDKVYAAYLAKEAEESFVPTDKGDEMDNTLAFKSFESEPMSPMSPMSDVDDGIHAHKSSELLRSNYPSGVPEHGHMDPYDELPTWYKQKERGGGGEE